MIRHAHVLRKSKYDKKDYIYVKYENGCKILNVIDPKTEISGISALVNVGSFHEEMYMNGQEGHGLAHFLEHMLFIESKTYNVEQFGLNYFMNFVTQHGGMMNGTTHDTHTNYYFAINSPFFQEAVDIFMHFFIDPTFNPIYASKEKNAIDNEYNMRRTSDVLGLFDILQTLTNASHPFRNFSCGNLETLQNDKFMLQQMKLIFNEFYCLSNMVFVVYHTHNVESTSWFQSLLNQIKERPLFISNTRKTQFDNDLYNLTLNINTNPISHFNANTHHANDKINCNDSFLLVQHKIKTTNNSIKFVFQIPSLSKSFANIVLNPMSYLNYYLSSKNKNSLYYILIKHNLIKDIHAEILTEFGNIGLFIIDVQLTDIGFVYRELIACLIVNIIRNGHKFITKTVHNALKNIGKIQFDFFNKHDVFDFVKQIGEFINANNKNYKMINTKLLLEYDFEKYKSSIHDFYFNLNSQNCILIYESNSFKLSHPFQTKWYNAEYGICYNYKMTIDSNGYNTNSHILHELLNIIHNCESRIKLDTNVIPKQIKLFSFDSNICNHKYPIKFETNKNNKYRNNNVNSNIWIRQHNDYNMPIVSVDLFVPFCHNNCKDVLIIKLYLMIVMHIMTEKCDIVANAFTSLVMKYMFADGILIKITTLNIFACAILSQLLSIFKNSNVHDFKHYTTTIISDLRSDLNNYIFENPAKISIAEFHNLIGFSYSVKERFDALNNITFDDIVNFDIFATNPNCKCLISGNIDKKGIDQIASIVCANFNLNHELHMENRKTMNFKNVLNREIRFLPFNKHENNINVSLIYNLGILNHYKQQVMLMMIMRMMENNYFQVMRTEKQLGYNVNCSNLKIGLFKQQHDFVVFNVLSSNNTVDFVFHEMKSYISNFKTTLKMMCQQLDNIKNILKVHFKTKFETIDDETAFNFDKICKETYDFDKKEKYCKQLHFITPADVMTFYDEFILLNTNVTVIFIDKHRHHAIH